MSRVWIRKKWDKYRVRIRIIQSSFVIVWVLFSCEKKIIISFFLIRLQRSRSTVPLPADLRETSDKWQNPQITSSKCQKVEFIARNWLPICTKHQAQVSCCCNWKILFGIIMLCNFWIENFKKVMKLDQKSFFKTPTYQNH